MLKGKEEEIKKVHGRAKVQVTGHMSQVIVLPIQKVS